MTVTSCYRLSTCVSTVPEKQPRRKSRTLLLQGNAGIEQSLLIVGITAMVCCIALVAGVGITQRCHIDTGGVHDILSHILGARLGGAVSVVYCFGQVRFGVR